MSILREMWEDKEFRYTALATLILGVSSIVCAFWLASR